PVICLKNGATPRANKCRPTTASRELKTGLIIEISTGGNIVNANRRSGNDREPTSFHSPMPRRHDTYRRTGHTNHTTPPYRKRTSHNIEKLSFLTQTRPMAAVLS